MNVLTGKDIASVCKLSAHKIGPASVDLVHSSVVNDWIIVSPITIPDKYAGLLLPKSTTFRRGARIPTRFLPPGYMGTPFLCCSNLSCVEDMPSLVQLVLFVL